MLCDLPYPSAISCRATMGKSKARKSREEREARARKEEAKNNKEEAENNKEEEEEEDEEVVPGTQLLGTQCLGGSPGEGGGAGDIGDKPAAALDPRDADEDSEEQLPKKKQKKTEEPAQAGERPGRDLSAPPPPRKAALLATVAMAKGAGKGTWTPAIAGRSPWGRRGGGGRGCLTWPPAP
jgi:hypothetical protein